MAGDYVRYIDDENVLACIISENSEKKILKDGYIISKYFGSFLKFYMYDMVSNKLLLKKRIDNTEDIVNVSILSSKKLLFENRDKSFSIYDVVKGKRSIIKLDKLQVFDYILYTFIEGNDLFFCGASGDNCEIINYDKKSFSFVKSTKFKRIDNFDLYTIDYFDDTFYVFTNNSLIVIDRNSNEYVYNILSDDVTYLVGRMTALSPSLIISGVKTHSNSIFIWDIHENKCWHMPLPFHSPLGNADFTNTIEAIIDRNNKKVLGYAVKDGYMFFFTFSVLVEDMRNAGTVPVRINIQ